MSCCAVPCKYIYLAIINFLFIRNIFCEKSWLYLGTVSLVIGTIYHLVSSKFCKKSEDSQCCSEECIQKCYSTLYLSTNKTISWIRNTIVFTRLQNIAIMFAVVFIGELVSTSVLLWIGVNLFVVREEIKAKLGDKVEALVAQLKEKVTMVSTLVVEKIPKYSDLADE